MRRFIICCFVILSVAITLWSCKENTGRDKVKNQVALKEIVQDQKLDTSTFFIEIDKSDFVLRIKSGNVLIKSYPIVLGQNPVDDKLMEGDSRTPEGIFRIRDFYPHSKWSKFIWIDYPNESSFNKHNRAKSEGRIPRNASIGGEIGIHGVPSGRSDLINNKVNWTLGCIAMTNEDVNEIYEFVFTGMEVKIQK